MIDTGVTRSGLAIQSLETQWRAAKDQGPMVVDPLLSSQVTVYCFGSFEASADPRGRVGQDNSPGYPSI